MMARRKSKAKQKEEALQALLGLCLLASFIVTYTTTESIQASITVGIIVFVIFIAVSIYIGMKRTERLKRSGIAEIDKMDGVQFEKYLGLLLRSQGYDVKVTKASGDFGADLMLVLKRFKRRRRQSLTMEQLKHGQ